MNLNLHSWVSGVWTLNVVKTQDFAFQLFIEHKFQQKLSLQTDVIPKPQFVFHVVQQERCSLGEQFEETIVLKSI